MMKEECDMAMKIEILEWSSDLTTHFIRLNKQWIEHFFKLEKCDLETLGNPKSVIIDNGGQIFFARLGSEIIGCCALIHHPNDDTYELAKMAVDPNAQNCGAGFKLGTAVIEYAKRIGVNEIFLEANTKLAASVHLHEKLGFRAVKDYHAAYDRCNLFIKLQLKINTAQDKYNSLKQSLEVIADKTKAIKMSAYMRNQFKFYGIQADERKTVFKEFINKDKKLGAIDWTLLDLCFDDEHREFQYFVLDYLRAMKKYLTYDDIPRLSRYIKDKQWWDTIDGIDRVIGSIAFTDKRVNELMLKWSTDDDFWIRRVAIDHQIGRKDRTNETLLEAILVNNFGSKEFFINKAIGWSLREYSKSNPRWVNNFIETYRSRMSALSIREASKYL
jgi:3-methyladenine DNA glycosylase AlkD/GNAT superfamily N-acetyltransferase